MAESLMIVDDSATMRKIIMRTVQMSGLAIERTEEAGNGDEADGFITKPFTPEKIQKELAPFMG